MSYEPQLPESIKRDIETVTNGGHLYWNGYSDRWLVVEDVWRKEYGCATPEVVHIVAGPNGEYRMPDQRDVLNLWLRSIREQWRDIVEWKRRYDERERGRLANFEEEQHETAEYRSRELSRVFQRVVTGVHRDGFAWENEETTIC